MLCSNNIQCVAEIDTARSSPTIPNHLESSDSVILELIFQSIRNIKRPRNHWCGAAKRFPRSGGYDGQRPANPGSWKNIHWWHRPSKAFLEFSSHDMAATTRKRTYFSSMFKCFNLQSHKTPCTSISVVKAWKPLGQGECLRSAHGCKWAWTAPAKSIHQPTVTLPGLDVPWCHDCWCV